MVTKLADMASLTHRNLDFYGLTPIYVVFFSCERRSLSAYANTRIYVFGVASKENDPFILTQYPSSNQLSTGTTCC
jgi:hypothetical protein